MEYIFSEEQKKQLRICNAIACNVEFVAEYDGCANEKLLAASIDKMPKEQKYVVTNNINNDCQSFQSYEDCYKYCVEMTRKYFTTGLVLRLYVHKVEEVWYAYPNNEHMGPCNDKHEAPNYVHIHTEYDPDFHELCSELDGVEP